MLDTSVNSQTELKGRKTPRHIRKPKISHDISKLSILIPCYNEADTIAIILDKVLDTNLINSIQKEVIVIDDCSSDDTSLMIEEYMMDNPDLPIRYIRHEKNQGKGAAVHTGIQMATGDYILIQDADLEYDPAEYNMLLSPIIHGYADAVYGSRFMGAGPHRVLFFWHTLGNKLLTFINNMLTNMNLTDAHTCYKLVSASTLKKIPLLEKRFAFDAELNAKLSQLKNIRIYEVGISYYGRTFAEGKKIRLGDALRTCYCLLKYTVFNKFRPKAEVNSLAPVGK